MDPKITKPKEPGAEEVDLIEIARVIVQRKTFIFKVCAAAVVFSACCSLLLKNSYTASARLLPPQKESGAGLSALLGQAGGLAGLAGLAAGGFGGSSDLYLGILKSRRVADAVIQRLDLQRELEAEDLDETRRKLERAVRFKAGKDGIITVAAESRDPAKAALLANTFVEELGRRSVQLNLSKAGSERTFLEKRLELVRRDLANAENDMKLFQERYKTIKADSQATVAIEGIARVRAEIVSKEVQLASLRNSMTDENSQVRALKAGIDRLKTQLAIMTGSGGAEDIIPATGNVPALGVEYVRKLREFKIQEAIFEQLTKQYEVAKLTEAKDSSSLQVLDEAVPPLKKSKPRRTLIVFLATLCAFFISLVAVFFQEYLSRLDPDDAERARSVRRALFRP
jgi:tyrosine-protein kinase Etk/Wzc